MTDWTTARVVRDRAGHAIAVAGITAMHLTGPRAGIRIHADRLPEFGPLTPVLDADGLPVVRTVGDLTARHIGQQVTAEGHTGVLSELLARDGMVQLAIDDADGPAWFPAAALNTTCEVLP